MRIATGLTVTAALLATATATPMLAAKADKKADKKDQAASTAVIETMNGAKYRMASTKMAERVTRIADEIDDQLTDAGEPAIGAPDHSDLVQVYVASAEVTRKLLTRMAKDFPKGTAGSFYGSDADWTRDAKAVFVAAKLAGKRPDGAGSQQLEIGVDGAGASPVQVGSAHDTLAGLERFSLSGIFSNGAWSSGSTDVTGRVPGGDIDWYNTTSGIFGFYDPKRSTYYAIVPRAKDARHVSVAVRTSTDAGQVIDRLELPGGGTLVELDALSGGLSNKAGLDPLTCRALETFSGNSSDPTPLDPAATLIRYTAGANATTDTTAASELLAPALEATGAIPMLVTAVGSDEEPLQIDAELAAIQGVDAVTLTMEVPAGQWTFAPAEGAQVKLPNGEPLIDHGTLTGSAGVLTGPGLDGVVAGDPSCGWDDLEFADDSAAEADPAAPDQ